MNYHASNERSQLSDEEDGIVDETNPNDNTGNGNASGGNDHGKNSAQRIGDALRSAAVEQHNRVLSGQRRHGSVVVGE